MAILEIKHLSKSFGDHEVLKDIDFTDPEQWARRRAAPCGRQVWILFS